MKLADISLIQPPDPDQTKVRFVALMSSKTRIFPTEQKAEAQVLIADQSRLWNILIKKIGGNSHYASERQMFRELITALDKGINTAIQQQSIDNDRSGNLKIVSAIPILDEGLIFPFSEILQTDPWFCLAALLRATAGFVNIRESLRSGNEISATLMDPRLTFAAAEVSALATPQANRLETAFEALDTAHKDFTQTISRADAIAARTEELIAKHGEEWGTFIAERTKQIEALSHQIADSIRLEASRDLWKKRGRSHLWWMVGAFVAMFAGIACVVLVALFVALPALEPTPFEIVTKSGYTTQKLVVFALCVIGAAWVLRFVARAIVENMSLRADAQHRQSMLETYLALRGEVGLKDEERVIILSALFHPLPGQPADENPPTLAGEAFQKFIPR
jgi:hypothetical protein